MRRVCIKDRVCRICGREFRGDRFKCPQCRYREAKATGKFGADYHRKYYKRYLRVDSPPRPKKSDPKDLHRSDALAKQTRRIHAEMAAITTAGLDPATALFRDYGVILHSLTSSKYTGTIPGGESETPCTNGKILVQDRDKIRK